MNFPFLAAKERLIRIMGTFDLATGHADTWDELLDSLESELKDVLGHYREALKENQMETLILWLSLVVYFESRGEPTVCQQAVAHVVLNRTKDGDVAKTVLAPYQFSWVPEKMHNGILRPEHRPNKESPAWKQAVESALKAIYTVDFYEATHFHATYIAKPKSWSNLKLVHTCGQHHFYKEIA